MVKIVGKINLDAISGKNPEYKRKKDDELEYIRKTREIIPDIESAMSYNIDLVAERMTSFEGAPENLIDARGSINVDAFTSMYSEGEISHDKKMTHEEKKGNHRTYDPGVQEKYGTTDQDKLVALIENDTKEKMRDGNVSEDLLFLMMNKVAGDRYITLKTSEYDDFRNGVDMVLVDTETDAVICTFDATVSDVKSRMQHKMDRAKNRIDNGKGLYMKYGVSFDENQHMKLGAIQNIPPLFLDLPKQDLKRILHVMDFKIDSELSDAEIEVVSGLLDKLDVQIDELETRAAKNVSYDSSRVFVQHVRNTLMDMKKPA